MTRGRLRLREINLAAGEQPPKRGPDTVARYAALFNQRDWEGLRALLASDGKPHQSAHPVRVGAADVGMFFDIYAGIGSVWLAPAWLEGREVIAVFERRENPRPGYFLRLAWRDGKMASCGATALSDTSSPTRN